MLSDISLCPERSEMENLIIEQLQQVTSSLSDSTNQNAFLVHRKIFVLSRMLRDVANPKHTSTQSAPDMVEAMEALRYLKKMILFQLLSASHCQVSKALFYFRNALCQEQSPSEILCRAIAFLYDSTPSSGNISLFIFIIK